LLNAKKMHCDADGFGIISILTPFSSNAYDSFKI
jgi:hypothetical protein